jgi:hypothetical protein
MLPSGVLPNYQPFCRIILLSLIIALELFVDVHIEYVLQYLRWLIFMSMKVMLMVSSGIEGVVHHEFLYQGQTVNHWCYLEVLKHLRENVRRKRRQLLERTPGSSIMTMCQLIRCY